jgi:hypothetical protein
MLPLYGGSKTDQLFTKDIAGALVLDVRCLPVTAKPWVAG